MYKNTINNNYRGEYNPFASQGAGGSFTHLESSEEAIVTDVVVNDEHSEYAADGYNVGAIQFRFVYTNPYRDQGTLNWALPLDSNITDYPLINEIVIVVKSLNRFYYTKKINTSSRVTAQPLYGLNEELSAPENSSKKIQNYQNSTVNPKKDDSAAKNKLGKYFKDQEKVYRLRHDEGDVIYEGRSGQSMRMGAAWKNNTNFKSSEKDQAPNLLLRVGPSGKVKPSVNTPFGLVTEDINDDLSSIWMVTDQIVPLKLSTEKSAVHKASVSDFPNKLDGNQIVINTDRFVINTKTGKILGNASNGIHWTTNKNFTVDSDQDYISKITRDEKITIGKSQTYEIGENQQFKIGKNAVFTIGGYFESTVSERISLISPKVYLGTKQSETQPVPLGAILAQFLSDFLDAHINNASNHVITPVGPGMLSPSVVSKLTALKAKVAGGASAKINSKVSYTG